MNQERYNNEVERLMKQGLTKRQAKTIAFDKELVADYTPRSYGIATDNVCVIMLRDAEAADGTTWKAGEKFRAAGCDVGPDFEPLYIDGKWRIVTLDEFVIDPDGPHATVRIF